MNKVLRSLLLGMLAFLSCQAWSYAFTTALTYTYDASGHVHIDRSTETEYQNLKYDGESNPLKPVDTRRENPVGENSRIGAFFALVDGLFVTKGAGKKADDAIQVTKDGVALPAKPKYKIPENYVQNPHRSGSYGEVVNGKFKERLRIDPPTQPGKKGPNYSHYQKNGKGTHYSPRSGDPDPEF